MRLLKKNIDRGSGIIQLLPEDNEDMWHAYNLIQIGDGLRSSTVRKIVNTSDTGTSQTMKKRTTLTIEVEAIDYDSSACALRIKGRTTEENDFVKKGSYHTIDLELHSPFSLRKTEWDTISLDRVDMATDPVQSADVAAIVMHEGFANVCLITQHMTIIRQKIEHTIPRKRKGLCQQHDRGMERFFDSIIQAILKHIDFTIVKAVILASPGFIKDQFFAYMLAKSIKEDEKHLLDNKNKFLLLHSSNGFKHALMEILQDPQVINKLSDTKAATEMKLLEQFMQLLNNEPDRAYYGLESIERANQAQAIECLLITDELFRNIDFIKRRRYVELVDSVKESSGDVRLFSSLHASGERLGQLTGIAAILRFPMPDLDNDEQLHHHDHADNITINDDYIPENPNRTVNHNNYYSGQGDKTSNSEQSNKQATNAASAW